MTCPWWMPANRRSGLDESFIVLLWLTSFTGMLLLVLRNSAIMAPLVKSVVEGRSDARLKSG